MKAPTTRFYTVKRVLAVAVLVLAVALAGCTDQDSPYGSKVGDRAHPFTLTTLNNTTFSLADQEGRVVLIDLMGANCSTCRAEMPELKEARAAFNTSEVVFLSVDLGSRIGALGGDDEQDLREFRDEFNASWQFAMDTDDVGENYQVLAVPTTYIVDGDGVIRFRHGGVASAEDLEQAIQDAL